MKRTATKEELPQFAYKQDLDLVKKELQKKKVQIDILKKIIEKNHQTSLKSNEL